MELTTQTYWEHSYTSTALSGNFGADFKVFDKLISERVPRAAEAGNVLELGCCPGRFLTIFGKLDYTLNGIDIIPSVSRVKDDLAGLGYKTGRFEQLDFTRTAVNEKFDVVCSFGLIEHFTDWEAVLLKHAELVKENGHLIVTTPNFRGMVQYIYHRLTDKENLDRHVVASMNPDKWKRILEKNGFELVYSGYFGHFFWDENAGIKKYEMWIQKGLRGVGKVLNKLYPGNPFATSFCGIIAKKKI